MQQRLYWIGIEQRAAQTRLGALRAQAVAMTVIEDTRKMVEQAEAAAKELSARFIGPRLGVVAPPPPPYVPPMSRGGFSTLGELRSANDVLVRYETYLQEYRERLAEDTERRRRMRDDNEEGVHEREMINVGDSILALLEECDRHADEMHEIASRR